MTGKRADEILRKVFYSNFRSFPRAKEENRDFHIGRMIGEMQKTLEIELTKEVEDPLKSSEGKVISVMLIEDDGSIRELPLDRIIIERDKKKIVESSSK